MSEKNRVACTDCDWQATAVNRRKALRIGFYHELGQGHDIDRQEEMRNEFDL